MTSRCAVSPNKARVLMTVHLSVRAGHTFSSGNALVACAPRQQGLGEDPNSGVGEAPEYSSGNQKGQLVSGTKGLVPGAVSSYQRTPVQVEHRCTDARCF